MEWIIVKPQGSLNSYDRAKAITRELYNISRPVYLQGDNEALATCFEMITHPDDDYHAGQRQPLQQSSKLGSVSGPVYPMLSAAGNSSYVVHRDDI